MIQYIAIRPILYAHMTTSQTALLAASWIGYFFIHSALASLSIKRIVERRLPDLLPWYRLIFNAVALILLIPPLVLLYSWRGPFLWQWEGVAYLIANGIAVLSIMLFFWSLRFYDGGEFFGTHQLKEQRNAVEDLETLKISPLHRFVRHPWYSIGLALVWTRDMDMALLISAISISLYFWLGSLLEERKLIAYHGDAYRSYRQRVPGLIPLPWKWLNHEDAQLLEESAAKSERNQQH